jgi:hypothetical protein
MAAALSRFYAAQAALAAAAGSPCLAERRAAACLEAGRRLAELVTQLHLAYRPPRRRRPR